MVSRELSLVSSYYFDTGNSVDYKGFKLYTYEDGQISDGPGDEEPEEESSEDVVSGNEVEEEPEDDTEEEEGEDSVSENTVSDNSVSDNIVSENEVHHYVDYEDPWEGQIVVQVDSHLDEYMPQVNELLTVIGGCVLFLAVCTVLKYIYKFFRIFF